MNRISKIFLLACVVLTMFAFTSCNTLKGESETKTGATVSISGTGTLYLKADIVNFSINVNETEQTTAQAQQAANKKMTEILAILKEFGIEDDQISTTALNFSTDYYWDNGKQIKTGESVSQTVYVTMKDIDSFPKLSDELGTRLNGISFYNVHFDSSKKDEASSQARELAYKNALEKAELYARTAGFESVRPISISEGYSTFTTANYRSDKVVMMEAAAEMPAPTYGTQTPSGLLTATIDVSVVFELK